MSSISYADGRIKPVKNLGWLLRHMGEVERMEVKAISGGGAYMECLLSDGRKYKTQWASWDVCRDWVSRRRKLKAVIIWMPA